MLRRVLQHHPREGRKSFDPAPDIIVSAIITGGVMGILVGLFSAIQASRTSPVEAMRE